MDLRAATDIAKWIIPGRRFLKATADHFDQELRMRIMDVIGIRA